MLRLVAVLTVFLVAACVGPAGTGKGEGRAIALTNVTVIDVTAPNPEAARVRNQTVIVDGGTIASVGNVRTTRVPRGAHVIDGRGRFLIPGLWDAGTAAKGASKLSMPLNERSVLGSGDFALTGHPRHRR